MASLDEAIEKLRRGRYEEGMIILQRLREQTPNDPDILYNLGMVYSDMGLIDKAVTMLESCVELRGTPHDHTALGVAYFRSGQHDKAVVEFDAALREDANDFYALRNYATVVAKQGKLEEAIHIYERAHRVNPEAPEVMYGLGAALEQKGELEQADEWYKKVLATPGEHQVRELAKEGRTRISHVGLKKHGANMAAVFYCLDALQKYEGLSQDEIRTITFDVALLGQRGLDINSPEKKYRVKSLPGEYSGLHMVCFMYVGFKIIDPSIDGGIDLAGEYEMAVQMHKGKSA